MSGIIKVGDRVGYAQAFLRQIQAHDTDLSQRRGVATEYPYIGETFGKTSTKLCRVRWDGEDAEDACLIKYLRVIKVKQ